jgi:hypothetical protein
LNPPPSTADPALAAAAQIASTNAFHLAVIVCAVLLVAGALVNLVGLRPDDAGAKKPASVDAAEPAT